MPLAAYGSDPAISRGRRHAEPARRRRLRERPHEGQHQAQFLGRQRHAVTGGLGQATARQAKKHKMTIIGVNTTGKKVPGFDRVVKAKDMAKVFPKADFLVVTLPITKGTENLIDRKLIDLLPNHCGIVNIGRARVMDYGAMVDRLRSSTLAGAVCDVFDPEPLPASSPWYDFENVIVTPHTSWASGRVLDRSVELFCDNLRRFARGEPLRNVVDPGVGY